MKNLFWHRMSAGTIVSAAVLIFLLNPGLFLKEHAPPRETPQTLFVAFDGVPYPMVERLYAEGKLQGFNIPSRLISVFPSTTTACFTGIFRPLGAGKGPGYDAQFFDWEGREVKGNLLEAYEVGGSGYKDFFAYMRSTGFQQVVMYTLPRFAARVDLRHLKPAVWNHPDKDRIFFYFGASDGAGHLDGPKAVEGMFLETVEALAVLREEYAAVFGRTLEMVLFSDHGFHWDEMKPMDVAKLDAPLRERGKYLADGRLADADGVAAITWGNISGGDFYTLSAKALVPLAEVLLETEGTDLVFYLEEKKSSPTLTLPREGGWSKNFPLPLREGVGGGGIHVYARRSGTEKALIHFHPDGKKFAYRAEKGDPLGYLPVLKRLKRAGRTDAEGFAAEGDWFAATADHEYPDALYRVWDAFFGLAQNPASLLLSTREDTEFGGNLTRLGAAIRGGLLGTHGALARNSSSAFIMTTREDVTLAPVVRYDEALKSFTNGQKIARTPPTTR